MAARNYLAITAQIKAICFDLSVLGQFSKNDPKYFAALQSSLNKKGIRTSVIATDPFAFYDWKNNWGVSANEMLYVGDRHQSINCANKAGMISVLVDQNQNLDFGQRFSICSIDDLLDYL